MKGNPGILIHFTLRIHLRTNIKGAVRNIIELHNEVIYSKGKVAVAKFGGPVASAKIGVLRDQISSGRESLLLLVAKDTSGFVGFESRLVSVHVESPTADLSNMAPTYYSAIMQTSSLWFTITKPFVPSDLGTFRLLSNGRALPDVIAERRSPAMLVISSR